jgi:tetratricopeptide (TPR) repeat protein
VRRQQRGVIIGYLPPAVASVTTELRDQLQATLGGAYSLEQELGGGGMSRVFAATETSLGRKVVVKVLPPDLAQGVSVERFKREITLAAQLQHPHIVPVLAAGETNGLPYYTMPLVDGTSLRVRLAKSGPLPIGEVISTLRDVAKALAYAHERGVVHRDIKPDNVLLSGGSAVVTDFGVAKALSAAKGVAGAGGETLTQVGSALGTPAYMAPEQAAADPGTNHRADLYAFGIMAYEMLAGRPPFHGRTPQKLLAAQMGETPEAISTIRPDTPPLLAELVMRCLEKDPDRRPQSAFDLVRVLESVTSGTGTPAMPGILLGGRRRPMRAVAIWAAATFAVGLLAKAAIVAIGLPEWVFPGALIVMALGLPVILFTAFVHHGAHQALTAAALTPGGSPVVHSTMTRLAVKASPWFNWRRTTMGGFIALGAFAVAVAAFMVMRALGIGPAASLLAAGRVADRERVIVTDFRAPGADGSLGNTVTEAVRTDLGQSNALLIMSPNDVSSALTRMQRPETTHVDLQVARDIAAREGIKGIIDGDLSALAGGFVLTMRFVDATNGEVLASYHEAIDGPKELIPAVDGLTRKLRGKIGESLRSVHASPPLDQVTTPSLDALRKYVEGVRANDYENNYGKAASLLRDAVSLDSNFAMAWRKLAIVMFNADMNPLAADSAISRAYALRDRLTERERLLATATYFDIGRRKDRAKAVAAYEALMARDSIDDVAENNLAIMYWSRRDYGKADTLYQREIRTRKSPFAYENAIRVRVDAGLLAAAESSLAVAKGALPNSSARLLVEAQFTYARHGPDSAEALLNRSRAAQGDPFEQALATRLLGNVRLLHGQLSQSARLNADALAQDSARGAPPSRLQAVFHAALVDAWFRELPARGVGLLDSALARTPQGSLPGEEWLFLRTAELFAMAGRADRARATISRYVAELPDSAMRASNEPLRHMALGEIALAEHHPTDAVREFSLGDRLPDGPVDACRPRLTQQLGRAYDLSNMSDSAIALFERYVATHDVCQLGGPSYPAGFDGVYLAGIHKRLGELYEAKGDRAKAADNYLRFIELWKNADPELQPKVAEVKRRLERLRDFEKK